MSSLSYGRAACIGLRDAQNQIAPNGREHTAAIALIFSAPLLVAGDARSNCISHANNRGAAVFCAAIAAGSSMQVNPRSPGNVRPGALTSCDGTLALSPVSRTILGMQFSLPQAKRLFKDCSTSKFWCE